MMRFGGTMVSNDQLFQLFSGMTYYQLEYEGDSELYKQSYEKVLQTVKDPALKSDISFMYNFEMGRIFFNKGRYKEALPFVETAYSIKPHNSDAESMFIGILADMVNKTLYNENGGAELLKKMDAYLDDFPELDKNITFKRMYLTVCLLQMDKYYYEKNMEKGETYRLKFEKFYPYREYEFLDINQILVKAYSTAGSYYFGRGDYRKSREMITRGLHYAPNSYLLKERLRALQ